MARKKKPTKFYLQSKKFGEPDTELKGSQKEQLAAYEKESKTDDPRELHAASWANKDIRFKNKKKKKKSELVAKAAKARSKY